MLIFVYLLMLAKSIYRGFSVAFLDANYDIDLFLSFCYLWDILNRNEAILIENQKKKSKNNLNFVIDLFLCLFQLNILELLGYFPVYFFILLTFLFAIANHSLATDGKKVRFIDFVAIWDWWRHRN